MNKTVLMLRIVNGDYKWNLYGNVLGPDADEHILLCVLKIWEVAVERSNVIVQFEVKKIPNWEDAVSSAYVLIHAC